MKSYKIIVEGKVQGVYYRKTILENAVKMGLNGYVKNLSNGNVEVGVNLEEHQYEAFIQMLKAGSSYSNVKNIEVVEDNQNYSNFKIAY